MSEVRVAIVTGGATGLGFAIAERLGRDGMQLVLASRSEERLGAAVARLAESGVSALAVPTDVRDAEAVRQMVARCTGQFGRVDVLINNAAGNFMCPAERLTVNGWNTVRGIVLDGAFYCSRFAGEAMIGQRSGCIVNILATYAWGAGAGTIHSACAKAGVLAMTRTLAVEWARYGIRVNGVAPGPVETSGASEKLWPNEEAKAALLATVPMGRFGRAEEVAEAVAFLVSDRASYINGDVITVDGAQWLYRGGHRSAAAQAHKS